MNRVLVIDDQAHVRATILSILRHKGFEVVGTADGHSGLNAHREGNFDLAIVDVYLPGIDGVKVIKELRSRNASLPIIAISGVELGASHYTALDIFPQAPGLSEIVCLRKPFRSTDLLVAVDKALAIAA